MLQSPLDCHRVYTPMRRFAIVMIGLVLALLLCGLLALRSQPLVLAAVYWAVDNFSELRLELREPRVDIYGGRLSAAEIHLVPKQVAGPALVSILDFAAEVEATALFHWQGFRPSLRARQLIIYVSENDAAADPAPTQWLRYLGWLPSHLHIDQVHLVTQSENTWIFPLKDLQGDRLASHRYRATADADYRGEPLGVELEVLELQRGEASSEVETRIGILAPESGSHFTLEGRLLGDRETFRYALQLDAYYRDISQFLRAFEGGKDLAGELRLSGSMVGDLDGFELSDARFVLDNMPEYGFEAGGRLAYFKGGESEIDLVAAGELSSFDYLVHWIDLDIGDFGRAQSSLRLSGSLDRPMIDEFRLLTSNAAGLAVSLSGQLALFDPAPGDLEAEHNSLEFDLQGPSPDVLERWLGNIPYPLGPWRASGRISGSQQRLAVDRLVIATGTPDTVELQATGTVDEIVPPQAEGESFSMQGLRLTTGLSAADSAQLARLLDLDLPPHHAVRALGVLAGSPELLTLSDTTASITGPGGEATVNAPPVKLYPGAASVLPEFSASIRVKLADTTALAPYIEHYTRADAPIDIPSLGPLGISAELQKKGASFRLRDIRGNVDSENVEIVTRGEIGDLAAFSGLQLAADFNLADPAAIRSLIGLPMKSAKGSLAIALDPGRLTASLAAQAGDTRVTGEAVAVLEDRGVEQLTLSLTTPHLHLEDLGLADDSTAADDGGIDKPGEKTGDRPGLVARIRDGAPEFPLDITVGLGDISGDYTSIERLDIHVSGEDNRYTLEQFTAVYDQAVAEIRGVIDLSTPVPALSLAGEAAAVPLNTLSRDLGFDSDISGALTVLGGVTLMGTEREELLGSLNGSVSFALENAVIEGAAYDLLATDLLEWIYSGAIAEKSTYLDCTMARFQLRNGVATSDSLYIESTRMVATGRAELDLVAQKMDMRITPLSKSRTLQVPSEVKLKGPMRQPKAEISPINAAADATAAALMLLPNLTMKLFGINQSSRERYRPCQAEP